MESVLNMSAHKHGNYHKYYTFHPSESRSTILSTGGLFVKMWKAQNQPTTFDILDIGCNEGNLSIDMLEQVKKELPETVKCRVLGIDIDSSLIDIANSKYSENQNDSCISFKAIDFMDKSSAALLLDCYLSDKIIPGFNMVCLFSVTMWIHLNHGDNGLIDFLNRAAKLLCYAGSLIIEPQPWKCYKAADKRCRKLGMTRPLHFSSLKMRNIEREITALLLSHNKHIATTDNSKLDQVSSISNEVKDDFKSGFTVPMGGGCWDLGKEGWGRTIFVFHRVANTHLILSSAVTSFVNEDKAEITASNGSVSSDGILETKILTTDDYAVKERDKNDVTVDYDNSNTSNNYNDDNISKNVCNDTSNKKQKI